MGRHELQEEGALQHGGRPEPEAVPEPFAAAPAGRRLRPEQSAAPGVPPAPVDRVRTGRVEAGRSGGRRRVGAPVKAAVLTVTAAAAMLGGTVVGVQAWKDPAGPRLDCPAEKCPTADPEGDASGAGEPVPGEERPRPESSRTATPSPSRSPSPPSSPRRTGRPEASRTPKGRPATQAPTRRPRQTGLVFNGGGDRTQGQPGERTAPPAEETPTQSAPPQEPAPTASPQEPPPTSSSGSDGGSDPPAPAPSAGNG
ncbi:hypothetical protein [Planomonospora sp. ID82291]|uniref:hypothetical protein n=1 Tax=Planomonospora sp. ID82291 TaxID=2738136 RepID=UPI0018C3E7C0|nr:hypothetical protein [Planomonospora sp. ID82291]MBG0815405.1 hypothetical protein [Planomonospora sp. ID82291]